MRQFKVLKRCAHTGERGKIMSFDDSKLTEQLVNQGIIEEVKTVASTEKKTRKPRAKKAD